MCIRAEQYFSDFPELYRHHDNSITVFTTVFFLFLNVSLRSPEYDALQVERVLDNTRGRDSNPQHVLLGGEVAWLGDPVQRIQVTTEATGEK